MDTSYLNSYGLSLTRHVGDCFTIFTTEGPIEVEFHQQKTSTSVVLCIRAPKSVRILRNEVVRRDDYDPAKDYLKPLNESLEPCPRKSGPLGSLSSKATESSSKRGPLAQYFTKPVVVLSKPD